MIDPTTHDFSSRFGHTPVSPEVDTPTPLVGGQEWPAGVRVDEDVQLSVPALVEAAESKTLPDGARLARAGRFVLGLPGRANDALLKAYIAYEDDPINAVRYAAETGVVAAETTLLNEALRAAAFGKAYEMTRNSLVAGAALGGATLMIEGAAGLATADLLGTERGKRFAERLTTKLRRFIPEGVHMNPAIEAGVAYGGGSALVLLAKQIEDPSRTVEQNRRRGLFTAGWASALLTTQGVLAANGISNPEPKSIAAALVGTGGVAAGLAKGKSWFSRRQQSSASGESNDRG